MRKAATMTALDANNNQGKLQTPKRSRRQRPQDQAIAILCGIFMLSNVTKIASDLERINRTTRKSKSPHIFFFNFALENANREGHCKSSIYLFRGNTQSRCCRLAIDWVSRRRNRNLLASVLNL